MQVLVFKEYIKEIECSDRYGDDYYYEKIVFRTFEKSYELDKSELIELRNSINLFNRKANSYQLVLCESYGNEDMVRLLNDYENHLKEEEEKRLKAEEDKRALYELKEKNKADKALGKIAKNLGISIDELRKKLSE